MQVCVPTTKPRGTSSNLENPHKIWNWDHKPHQVQDDFSGFIPTNKQRNNVRAETYLNLRGKLQQFGAKGCQAERNRCYDSLISGW